MKLGCLPSAQRDLVRRLQLDKYLTGTPPAPPPAKDYSDGPAWDEFANDRCDDCAVAAAANAIRLVQYWTKAASSIQVAGALDAYKDLTGFDLNAPQPGPASDPGVDMATVLKYWHSPGIDGERCDKYVTFDWKQKTSWCTAIYLFGFAYVGFALPDSIVKKANNKDYVPWITTDPPDPPDPANGHCVTVAGYSPAGLKIVSWGTVIDMSWDFAATYVDPKNGAYAVLLPSWVPANPNALDLKQLAKDLAVVQGGGAKPAPQGGGAKPAP